MFPKPLDLIHISIWENVKKGCWKVIRQTPLSHIENGPIRFILLAAEWDAINARLRFGARGNSWPRYRPSASCKAPQSLTKLEPRLSKAEKSLLCPSFTGKTLASSDNTTALQHQVNPLLKLPPLCPQWCWLVPECSVENSSDWRFWDRSARNYTWNRSGSAAMHGQNNSPLKRGFVWAQSMILVIQFVI